MEAPPGETPPSEESRPPVCADNVKRRRWRMALITAALVAGPFSGYYFGVLVVAKRYSIPDSARYSRVEIWDLAIQGASSHPEINDLATVNTFHSLFTADDAHRLPSAGKIRKLYILRFVLNRPEVVYSDAPETIEVWDSPTGLVWTDGQADYRLHGELSDWFAALPAIRAAQLLRNHTPSSREIGLKLRAADGPVLVDALLKLLDSENEQLRAYALQHLPSLIKMRRIPFGGSFDWTIVRDQRRSLDAPHATEVARKLTALLQQPTRSPIGNPANRSIGDLRPLCDCLAETGDQTTANELARLLPGVPNDYPLDELLTCLETIYGLPPTYQRRGICGNSSAEEVASFNAEMSVRRGVARQKLLAWHAAHSAKPRTAQLDAVLEAWQPQLAQFTSSQRGSGLSYPTPAHLFVPLWRIGPELEPAIARRQQTATGLAERGALEFLKVFLTADCDPQLVEELLAGTLQQQRLACQIIGVSGRRDWTPRLDTLQRKKLREADPGDFYDVEALTESATAALWLTLNTEALPLLRKARQDGFSNHHVEALIRKHDLPASEH